MSIVIWLIKSQWNLAVEHLTYEKQWCIDRVSNLLLGVINIVLVLLSVLHHSSWIIPLIIINLSCVFSTLTGEGVLHRVLAHFGFQERVRILHQLRIESQAREKIQNYPLAHGKIIALYEPKRKI